MLEAMCHDHSWFVTLTYNDENLPEGGNLVPAHVTNYIKRLRASSGEKLRFFAVCEYGERTWRAHYHLIVFGLRDPDHLSRVWRNDGRRGGGPFGHVYVGSCTSASAQYVAGYCLKKMTARTDPRLEGRHPEFARMSNRPGIGVLAAHQLSSYLTTEAGARDLAVRQGELPQTVRINGKEWPLGRLLKQKMAEDVGQELEPMERHERVIRRFQESLLRDGGVVRFEAKKQKRAADAAFRLSIKDQKEKLI